MKTHANPQPASDNSVEDFSFQFSLFSEPQLHIKYWCVYYDSLLCGMGKTKREAYSLACATLGKMGLSNKIKAVVGGSEDIEPLLKPLGEVLVQAGLISTGQVEIALCDQQNCSDRKLGEILSLRGWIKQQTADFFAEEGLLLVQKPNQHRIGDYFQQAALLESTEIEGLLFKQKEGQTWIPFGALVVVEGYLKQETVDWFVKYLSPASI